MQAAYANLHYGTRFKLKSGEVYTKSRLTDSQVFNPHQMLCTIVSEPEVPAEETLFKKYADKVGLRPGDLGRVFHFSGRSYRIVGMEVVGTPLVLVEDSDGIWHLWRGMVVRDAIGVPGDTRRIIDFIKRKAGEALSGITEDMSEAEKMQRSAVHSVLSNLAGQIDFGKHLID